MKDDLEVVLHLEDVFSGLVGPVVVEDEDWASLQMASLLRKVVDEAAELQCVGGSASQEDRSL